MIKRILASMVFGGLMLFGLLGMGFNAPGNITALQPAQLEQIPSDARFVLVARESDGPQIAVMDETGQITLITCCSDSPRHYTHVAVSPDRTRIVATIVDITTKRRSLWLFDLAMQTEAQLVPMFHSVGTGGVDWGVGGFIYFAAQAMEPFGFPDSDIYRIRWNGTNLEKLTDTFGAEADVSVSADGTLITYVMTVIDEGVMKTILWISGSDGSNSHPVYFAGEAGVNSAHDPEFSPDNSAIVFSQVNPNFVNWPENPILNTAHDLYILDFGTGAVTRITPEGGIQIIPDWVGKGIVYTDMSEEDEYIGMAIIGQDGTNRQRFGPPGGLTIRWIPE